MSLKNKILVIFFAMNIFISQSLQAMDWADTAKKCGTYILPAVGIALYKFRNEIIGAVNFTAIMSVKKDTYQIKTVVNGTAEAVKELQEKSKTILTDLSELRKQFSALDKTVVEGFANAKTTHEILKDKLIAIGENISSFEEAIKSIPAEVAKQIKEQLEFLKMQMDGFRASMEALEEKIKNLATKEDVQETITQAFNPITEQLGRIEAGQEQQRQSFENAIQELKRQMRADTNQVVHTVQGLPTMFALSGYMIKKTIHGSAQLPRSTEPKLLGSSNH